MTQPNVYVGQSGSSSSLLRLLDTSLGAGQGKGRATLQMAKALPRVSAAIEVDIFSRRHFQWVYLTEKHISSVRIHVQWTFQGESTTDSEIEDYMTTPRQVALVKAVDCSDVDGQRLLPKTQPTNRVLSPLLDHEEQNVCRVRQANRHTV